MSPQDNKTDAWTERIDAIMRVLDVASESLAGSMRGSAFARQQSLQGMIRSLRIFGDKQLTFFKDGFASGGRLKAEPLYLAEHAFDVTINQIGYDLDIILRSIHHRTLPISNQAQATLGFRKTLDEADRYANALLHPVICAGLIEPITVITCYQQSLSSRIIPYAPVAMIGIPFTATLSSRDLALIAHEAGHSVYWRMLSTGLEDAAFPAWILNWWEEIFADVYGCVAGGPASAFTLLEMVRGIAGTRWLIDDGVHPTPMLRPLIYHAALRKMADLQQANAPAVSGQLEERAALLQTELDAWLKSIPAWLTVRLHDGSMISVTEAKSWLERAADALISDNVLGKLLPHAMDLWRNELNEDSLDKRVSGAIDRIQNQPVAELLFDPNDDTITLERCGKQLTIEPGATGRNSDWELARDGDAAAVCVLEQAGWNPWWLAVLSAGFWTTEGPGAGNPQPPS